MAPKGFAMGIVRDLSKLSKPKSIIAVDTSTNSFAWSKWEDKEPTDCGEFYFAGDEAVDRITDCAIQLSEIFKSSDIFNVDLLVIESTIGVASQMTAIKLAYTVGSVIAIFALQGIPSIQVAPITWQSAIGNPNLTPKEKRDIKMAFPDKSVSWYKNKGRLMRKERTKQIAAQYFDVNKLISDNISDACGLGLFICNQLGD